MQKIFMSGMMTVLVVGGVLGIAVQRSADKKDVAGTVLVGNVVGVVDTTVVEVEGVVVDAERGKPLAGVTVVIKGTQKGVLTDSSGRYVLLVNAPGKILLVVSRVGYVAKEVVAVEKRPARIRLVAQRAAQGAVVVTGYGANKGELESLDSVAVNLAGRVSGMLVQPQRVMNRVVLRGMATTLAESVDAKRKQWLPGGSYGNGAEGEGYSMLPENGFLTAVDNPLSTFSADVDAASYSNVRRFLNLGQLPPVEAVRVEEMINYFHYEYPQPKAGLPFTIYTEMGACPWSAHHKLVLVGLQGKLVPADQLPASNLVFLIDVSGSMSDPNKLPLVKASMKLLVDQLRAKDKVSVVVYAGNAGLVLPATSGANKAGIKDAIDKLDAGGSTAGGAGIELAYKTAREQLVKGGNNRVILCTDGDFNVGVSSEDELGKLIEQERKSGVYLTVLGYGMGDYQDAKMQELADKGNGNHAYIDNLQEARKVLISEFGGTLFTIAKDVKLQVEFNPARVQAYRLIGYENRLLAKEDFNNDVKDAGEMGSGHVVTALYEVIPVGVQDWFLGKVDPLKYQVAPVQSGPVSNSDEWMTMKFRYKQPGEDSSRLLVQAVKEQLVSQHAVSENFRFAAAVAEFGLLLRNSGYKQQASYGQVVKLATGAYGKDEEGYRHELVRLVQNAQALAKGEEGGVSVNY